MPSGVNTRHIDMPKWLYEQLRGLAASQGRTITDVHQELLTTALWTIKQLPTTYEDLHKDADDKTDIPRHRLS